MINKYIELAKQSIKDKFAGKETKILLEKEIKEKRGVFVTLTKDNEIRGSIGFPYPTLPLGEAIIKAAKNAAFSDPKFPPLNEKELPEIRIELSILDLPKKIEVEPEKRTNEIKIGEHGLICDYQGFGSLLLPQFATEHNFDPEQFLRALCEKAGIPLDTWKQKDFKLWKFQTEVIKEE